MMNTAKDFFEKCRRLDQRINAKLEEAQRVRALACRTTTSYSDEPRGGSAPQSKVEIGALRLIELEEELNATIDEYVDHRREAQRVIDVLSDSRYRDVLSWRYFSFWSWDKIAEAMGCERMQVWRLHGRALQEANCVIHESATIRQRIVNSTDDTV